MFWVLFLAHLLADYPFQPDRLVAAKKRLPGLTIHVAIHWIVMTILTWPVRTIIWPYVLAVTLFHFAIDYFKVILGNKKPQWVIAPYLWDQPLHWISLIVVAYWMAQTTNLSIWQVPSPWWIYGIGVLMATHIWFVTERVITYRDPQLQLKVVKTMWWRMAVRLLLFVLIVVAQPLGYLIFAFSIGVTYFSYRRNQYPLQWLLMDLIVALVSAATVFIILANF